MNSRKAHLELLDYVTSLQLAKIDHFIEKEYTPDFVENFMGNSGILNNIQNAQTNEEKGMEILEFAQAALPLINERRNQMADAAWSMNTIIRGNIEEHYQEMLNTNQALTAHLSSAAEVVEIRKNLQERSIIPSEIIPIDKMNTILENLLKHGTKAEDIPQLVEQFKKSLK
jgi:type III secretory pathway component EscV